MAPDVLSRVFLPVGFLLALMASQASGFDLLTFTESDTNTVYSPCHDTTVQKGDGFTFGLAFHRNSSFFVKGVQHSPCDSSLSLSDGWLSLFRPQVDQITLLTINATNFKDQNLTSSDVMVAFAGSKFAAVSFPHTIISDVSSEPYIVTSFTLVLDFNKGRLQNLLWKSDGCSSCEGNSAYKCLRGQDCAIPLKDCKALQNGNVDCSLSFQTSFSGSDKHDRVFNSWYEIGHLHQYSLYGLYSNLKSSLSSQYNNIF